MRRQFMVSLAAKTNQNWLVLPTRQSQMELGREVELKRKSLWADFFTLIFMFIPAYPSKTHTHTNHEVNTTHNTTMNHESLAKQTTDITSDITKSTIPQRKFLDSQKASSSDSSRREAVSSSPVTADL